MELGTAILCSSAIFATVFGIVAIVFKLINSRRGNNNIGKRIGILEKAVGNPGDLGALEARMDGMEKKMTGVRYTDTCDERFDRLKSDIKSLKTATDLGFKNVSTQISELRKRFNSQG